MSEIGEDKRPVVPGYSALTEIGRGGFSVVYSAVEDGSGRRVAVKVLDLSTADTGRAVRESTALGRMTGLANVVGVYRSLPTRDGRPALVMELMDTTLAERVAGRGPMPIDEVLRWLAPVAQALDTAHLRGVTHRDVKPENILFAADGRPALADFGLAGSDTEVGSTMLASLSATHAPPERLNGDVRGSATGDLYSLASTIYSSMTGHPPFGTPDTEGLGRLVRRIESEPPPADPRIPPPVLAVLGRAMAKAPATRHRSASELVDALRDAAAADQREGHDTVAASVVRRDTGDDPRGEGQPIGPPPFRPVTAAGSTPPGRRVRRSVGVVGAAVLAVALAGFAVTRWGSDPEAQLDAGAGPDGRAVFLDYYDADGSPPGWSDCVTDRVIENIDDPAGLVGRLSSTDPFAGDQGVQIDPEADFGALTDAELACSAELFLVGTEPELIEGATSVSVNEHHACLRTVSGAAACWGDNAEVLRLDENGFGPLSIPHPVVVDDGGARQVEIASWGGRCVLDGDGTVACRNLSDSVTWGSGYIDGRGSSAASGSEPLTPVDGPDDVESIAATAELLCGLRSAGEVVCRGENHFGQLGNGSDDPSEVFVGVRDIDDATAIAAGEEHACVLRSDASAWCWGITGDRLRWTTVPERIDGLPPLVSIAAGVGFSCGVADDGDVWCWGYQAELLAQPEVEGDATPRRIEGPPPATSVTASGRTVCTIGSGEAGVWCFGRGASAVGEVPELGGVIDLGVTDTRSCAVTTDGAVGCWGEMIEAGGGATASRAPIWVPGPGGR